MTALWTSEEIVAATGGTLIGDPFKVSGVTFDSREVERGWLFVAMPGTVADGHDYCGKAFAAGASAALVSKPVDGPHVLVDDVPKALAGLAIAARDRCHGTIIGVTGLWPAILADTGATVLVTMNALRLLRPVRAV